MTCRLPESHLKRRRATQSVLGHRVMASSRVQSQLESTATLDALCRGGPVAPVARPFEATEPSGATCPVSLYSQSGTHFVADVAGQYIG